MSDSREFLRHALATLAYRGGKATRGAGPEFASFQVSPTSRTPAQILAHIGDLMDWGLSIARGAQKWHDSASLEWEAEVARFHATLAAYDAYLASDEPLDRAPELLFQGGIADALTHVGQLTMLRRAAGVPMKGENYARAAIEAGRVGPDQAPPDPKNEFD